MMVSESFTSARLWARIYLEVVITEEGSYAKSELPENYAGAQLEVKMPLLLLFMGAGGSVQEMMFYDYLDVLDKDGNKGIGYSYDIYGGSVSVSSQGPSSYVAEGEVEFIEDIFTESEKAKAQYYYTTALIARGVVDG